MGLAQMIIAAVTIVVAAVGLRFAKVSAEASKDAVKLSHEMLTEADVERREATAERREIERDRKRNRVEAVSNALWDAYVMAQIDPSSSGNWESRRWRLAQAVVGLEDELPVCAYLSMSGTSAIMEKMEQAKKEIAVAIEGLSVP
jgi:hypothetical protein